MDAAAEIGKITKHQVQPLSMEMSYAGRDNIHFPCSADHDQDWQSYPVDLLYFMTSSRHTHILESRCRIFGRINFVEKLTVIYTIPHTDINHHDVGTPKQIRYIPNQTLSSS